MCGAATLLKTFLREAVKLLKIVIYISGMVLQHEARSLCNPNEIEATSGYRVPVVLGIQSHRCVQVIRELLSKVRFNLTKTLSNAKDILEHIQWNLKPSSVKTLLFFQTVSLEALGKLPRPSNVVPFIW